MSSTTPLTDAINALITYANETTGKNDETLSDAVESLVNGYKGGISIDGIITGLEPSGDITITVSSFYPRFRERVFMRCANITSVFAPNLTNIRSQTFAECSGITSISFPELISAQGSQHFSRCSNLTNVYLPKMETFGDNFFQVCTNLEILDLPSATSINYVRFLYGCSKLKTLILRYPNNVVPISNDALTSTPFASDGTGGTIYVPQALIPSYQSATNWSTILESENNQILPIEGSIYETQYANGTPIPTT